VFRFRLLVLLALLAPGCLGAAQATLSIDYPAQDSLFPPDFAAPTFLFRDPSPANSWIVQVTFANHALNARGNVEVSARGDHLQIGEIDPRCVSDSNQPPTLTQRQAESRTWIPDPRTWETIKRGSANSAAIVTIRGIAAGATVSRGSITIHTSRDPVGAPIFYRDVPLMPSASENGVIKPLASSAVPLIAWRLRNVSETGSRILMQDLHSCANCHSFSRDGKTLGMDLDGPQNDKGLYTLVPVKQNMSIRNQDVLSWTSLSSSDGGPLREGFMSQVSPDGSYVVTTIKTPGSPNNQIYYVANFTDYRFLQVFYPTRGILAWYDRVTRKLLPLPGADDPRYVQASAVWSPDGKYLVFARAIARDPYPPGKPLATYANDPQETPIQYDLFRIPFNEGKGGRAEPIAGASQNGMSNSFPKVSPDGHWIVFVQAHNGQLMRPDGKLYIVPSGGGPARLMRCNTDLMNSWHSFSPNGRWMVFSSKSRSPYTQMFLTHIDEQGNDSPAILIENSTAANRAVNIPEFVNIPPAGISRIDTPAADFFRQYDLAANLAREHKYDAAIPEWTKAVAMSPDDARAHNNYGFSLARVGRVAEAITEYRRALDLKPAYPDARNNLAVTLISTGKSEEAIPQLRAALEANPEHAEAHNNLGRVLAYKGLDDEAVREFRTALRLNPAYPEAHNNLAVALTAKRAIDEAIENYRAALDADPDYADAHNNLGSALAQKDLLDEAIPHFQRAVDLRPDHAGAEANLGRALFVRRHFEDAISHLERAMALGNESAELQDLDGAALTNLGRTGDAIRHFERAAELQPDDVDSHTQLGRLLTTQGGYDRAIPHLQKAVALSPPSAALLRDLGYALMRHGQIEEAASNLEKAAGLDPGMGEVRLYWGMALMMQNRPSGAVNQWREALRINPRNVAALNETAWVLSTAVDDSLRNGAEAIRLASLAVDLTHNSEPSTLSTLATAYAEAGRFEDAIETQTRAADLANQTGKTQLIESYRARLLQFQAHRPLRARQ
jgi:Flp pilus assembly protein TadD